MDIGLYARVLWRFRLIVLGGLLLAVCLAVLSVASASLKGSSVKFSYRQSETWTSSSMIWVTQTGFPLGRSIYDQYLKTGTIDASAIPRFSDPQRFSSLATVFVPLVTSDGVRNIMRRQGPIDGVIGASQPTLPGNSSLVLPFVNVFASASSPTAARKLSDRASRALIAYVKDQQNANKISDEKRVVLQVVSAAQPAVLTVPRSKTRPIIVLLATLFVVIGLVFMLENLRPRARPLSSESHVQSASAAAGRRTA